jgi:chaperonin GroEL
LSVGATYYSEKTGDDLSLIMPNDLGKAKKVIVDRSSTIIIKDEKVVSQEDIEARVEQLHGAHKASTTKTEKEFILSRIASLTGGVGVIYVGGNTDLEHKELFDRVDDAVCAVRSATLEGILPGGGVALFKEATYIEDDNYGVAGKILAIALRAPLLQIFSNAGLELSEDIKKQLMYDEGSCGMNVKNGNWGDMYEMGVIDPMKVTKNALQNAVSVAVTLLSTNAIVTMARSYDTK